MTVANAPSSKLTARLATLGAIDLALPDGAEPHLILGRPKRLGLLAYLLLARPGAFHRRDQLVALFWPDLDQKHARASLRQALHWLRRALGRDAILARGEEEVAVDTSLVWCDCVEMQARVAADDLEGALALYRGALLPGLHLGGAVELDGWLEQERDRFARHAVTAATTLAQQTATAGDLDAAIGWSRLAVELAPYNEQLTCALMQLLDNAGDPAAAIAIYESFAIRLKRDVEMDVAPETTVLVDTIRRQRTARKEPDAITPIAGRHDSPNGEQATIHMPVPERSPEAAPRAPARSLRHHARWALTIGLLAVATIIYVVYRPNTAAIDRAASHRIAVLPFTLEGSADLAWLRDGMADLLSTRLHGAGDVRSVDVNALLATIGRAESRTIDPALGRQVAQRFDAGLFVLGGVMEAGGRLRAKATLYDARGTPRGSVEAYAGEERQLFALVDELAQQLVMLTPLRPPERLARLGALTTESFPALKAYLAGERLLRAGIVDSAEAEYARAIEFDSTFALAWYRIAVARWRNAATTGDSDAHRRALLYASRLAPRDQLLLAAFDALHRSQDVEAERLYREVLSSHPDDVDAWVFLGEVITYHGLWRGRAIAEARRAFERALALDSTNIAALDDLSWIAAMEERFEEGAALSERMLAFQPNGHHAVASRVRVALARRDQRAEQAAIAELRGKHWNYLNWTQRDAHFSGNLEGRVRVARLLTEPSRSDASQRLGHTVMARYLVDRGRWSEAFQELEAVKAVMPDAWYPTHARYHLAPLSASTRAELAALGRTLESWSPAPMRSRLAKTYYLGVVGARLGDSSASVSMAADLDAWAASTATNAGQRRDAALARDLALGVRAWSAWTRGQSQESMRFLEQLRPEGWWQRGQTGGLGVDAVQVWLRADVLSSLGRDDEALRLFAPLGFMWGDAGMLAAKHLRMAEIHDRRGRREQAVMHYERFVQMWRECDPELRGLVQKAERTLAQLKRAPT